jgi:hypothetical protein
MLTMDDRATERRRSTAEILESLSEFQQSAPVNVVGIAETLGIAVWESPDMGGQASGRLFKDSENGGPSGFSIVVNTNDAYRRKRFTIAHEIAHFLLHRTEVSEELVDDTFYRSGLSNQKEAEANRMAASILMPHSLIKQYKEQGITSVDDLADLFEVSKQAMSIRLGLAA